MREFIININDFSKASKFCELSAISKCINVELKSERYIINAKSLPDNKNLSNIGI